MLPRNWIIIAVLIGMIVTASAYWIGAWDNKYSQLESSNLSSSYNTIDEMATTTQGMEDQLGKGGGITTIGFLDFIVTGGYQVLVSIFSVPVILVGFVRDMGGQMNIPPIFINGFIVLISVAAIFGIVGAIFRRKV